MSLEYHTVYFIEPQTLLLTEILPTTNTSSRFSQEDHKGTTPEDLLRTDPKAQVNKYTGRPFSAKFWQILEKRKKLPVWEYYKQFIDMVRKSQSVVLVGETGSGKTTQVRIVCTTRGFMSVSYISVQFVTLFESTVFVLMYVVYTSDIS